jgi:hypothetical protein
MTNETLLVTTKVPTVRLIDTGGLWSWRTSFDLAGPIWRFAECYAIPWIGSVNCRVLLADSSVAQALATERDQSSETLNGCIYQSIQSLCFGTVKSLVDGRVPTLNHPVYGHLDCCRKVRIQLWFLTGTPQANIGPAKSDYLTCCWLPYKGKIYKELNWS